MTIHVSVTELQARIAELLEAARRGEEVVIDEAGGVPVRMVAVDGPSSDDRDRIVSMRRAALGMWAHLAGERDVLVRDMKQTEAEIEEDWRRKFGPAD